MKVFFFYITGNEKSTDRWYTKDTQNQHQSLWKGEDEQEVLEIFVKMRMGETTVMERKTFLTDKNCFDDR